MKKFAPHLMTLVLGSLLLLQSPAFAAVYDPDTYSNLQQHRQTLLIKESDLLKRRDNLNKVIDDLNRRNTQHQYDLELNQLSRKLRDTYYDLQKVRMDLRDVEQAMS